MNLTSFRTRILEEFRRRMFVFLGLSGVAFFLLFVQLINLMLIQGSEYQQKSRMNMEDYIPIPASRGEMYDRTYNGTGQSKLLVSSRPAFNVSTVPAKFENAKQKDLVLRRIAVLLNIPYDEVEADLKTKNPWQRYTVKEDVSFESIVVIASHEELFPNITYEDAPVRVYNFGPMFSHLAGYIGSISQDEYKTMKDSGYKYYQKVGKTGLEKQYDQDLRGTDGFIRRIVDVKRRIEGEEIGKEPVQGKNYVLTVDYEVQRAIYEAMGDQVGSAIVVKPTTGEVIALVSKPDYDSNLLIAKNNSNIMEELLKDPKHPFLTRPIMSKYPPASTFKLVTSVAGLEDEKWTPNNSYTCYGKYVLQGYIDKDFYCYGVHGSLDLFHAIAQSCSAYFYNMGYKIGPTVIMKYAKDFGYTEKTGIDLPGEIAGFIPSKSWKQKTFGQSWFDGDTINLSIGQGFTSVTPIEVTGLISALVNNGTVYKPHIVKEIRSPDNSKVITEVQREKLREIPLSSTTLSAVKYGMRLSVTEGTNVRLRTLKIPVAGKTGTAQTNHNRKDNDSQHAWFAGFGPYEGDVEKSIVVVVMIENGVAGAATAVPVAEKAFQKMISLGYFDDTKQNDYLKFDYVLIFAVSLLVIIGILSIYSAGYDPIEKTNTNLYRKQLIVFIIGLILMISISVINYQQLGEFSLMIFVAILLVVIGTTFLGSVTRGTKAWINLGIMKIQPSEFMKLATVILLAKYLEMRERDLRYFRELLIPTVIVFIPVLFIMLQPDFGTAMIFIPVLFAMLFVGGADVTHLVSIVLIAVISLFMPILITYLDWAGMADDNPLTDFYNHGIAPFVISFILLFIGLISYLIHLFVVKKYFRKIYIPSFVFSLGLLFSVVFQRYIKDYQKNRLLVFLNPDLDPHGSGYNVIQAKIAVGSGGFFGKGFMKGSQTQLGYLPEKWTDFIFAVVSEEWGFIGATLTLVLLGIIVYKGLIISLESKDKYASLLATGITTIFICHIIINIGMVLGIMPVTGLPLCFVSYGGSNLLMCMIGVGILSSISMKKA